MKIKRIVGIVNYTIHILYSIYDNLLLLDLRNKTLKFVYKESLVNINMSSIKDSIIQYIQNEDTKKEFFSMIEPVYKNIYNEIYPYIWFVSIYMVILTFIILVNLVLVIRVLNNLGGFYISPYETT